MVLFRKKEVAKAEMPGTVETSGTATIEENGGDSRICYRHLEAQFKMRSTGVALKLYIENFKRMNELFGFSYCEALLEDILGYLEQETRCTVYRYVGVEFIIILKNHTQGEAVRLAERIMKRFEDGWKVQGTDCTCSIQVGLCSYPGYASSADELLKCLDLAVARAAESGSSQYAIYDQKLHMQFQRRQAIARYLGTALAKNEIEVRYRPTYDVSSQKFTRAEFYMRLFIKGIGMVGYSEFIPIAEDTGQIRAIDYYALDKAAAMIARLIEEGKEFDSIALPISPVILQQSDFLDIMEQLIEYYNIPAGKLAVEVDEYDLSTDFVNMTFLMQGLKELGVELVLDNFGSGYSGISRLLELPVDTLKFERMFIWQLETNPQSEPVIEGLTQIGKRLGKKLIAEGVETEAQVKALTKFDCELQQGFYYASTLPEDKLAAVIGTSLRESRQLLEQEKEKQRR